MMSAFGESAGFAFGPRPSFWPSRGKIRNHEDLGRAVRLRGEPPDRAGLRVARPDAPVPLAEEPAEVPPFRPQPPAGLAREVLGRADVGDVLIERHALREPLLGNEALHRSGTIA